jgi:microcystin-dependent protein
MFTDPYLANVTIFAGNFAPRGWLFCQGQQLAISENEALFALIGTIYGGDGVNTFALPDLRGRVAIHPGQGPGLSNYVLGQVSGTESITLLASQLPSHAHAFTSATGNPGVNNGNGTAADPTNAVPAVVPGNSVYNTATSGTVLGQSTCNTNTAIAGQGFPVSILSPFLAMNYIIAVEGIFPSRN